MVLTISVGSLDMQDPSWGGPNTLPVAVARTQRPWPQRVPVHAQREDGPSRGDEVSRVSLRILGLVEITRTRIVHGVQGSRTKTRHGTTDARTPTRR